MISSAFAVAEHTLATERFERRLAAILAADVAGYSRLMGMDEDGTLAALSAHRRELTDPKIEEHHGRIVKTTGDGLLIEFASVVDAVRCAVDVQREMAKRNADVPRDRRIEFRVGIHQGDVIVEDEDIFGDAVNIAARLESLAQPGGICISGRVHGDAAGKINLVFENAGAQQLKNIARAIQVYRIRVRTEPEQQSADAPEPASTSTFPPLPDKPSVAVLPFTNMSNDPEQEFFSDGVAEDIITALSCYPSLFVIARNSSFTYKGRVVEVKQIGRELGVRYVLEGSLRKSGSRIRITAQLVEAEAGKHVWAHRYDRDLADIFTVQDEITEAVTIAIVPAIADAERQRVLRKPPANLDVWAAYQRGLWHMGRVSSEDYAAAEGFFAKAIELDPNFSGGYRGLAFAQFLGASIFQRRSLSEAQASAEELARRAIALDPSDAESRSILSQTLSYRGDNEGALAEADRALAISPNLAFAHGRKGVALVFSGRPEAGIIALRAGMRLDPLAADVPVRWIQVICGLYFCHNYAAAIDEAKALIRSYPDIPNSYRWLAASLGQLGRIDEAKEALTEAIAVTPASFDMYVRNRVPWMRLEDHVHMLEGLRKAGWEG